MTNIAAARHAFRSGNFWIQLEASLDLATASITYECLVYEMIEHYTRHMPLLDADTARDPTRREMLRQALAICARH
jgi:hypothetical protein